MEDYKKKYEEALERARKLWNEAVEEDYITEIRDYETIFPELAESEDERIRKKCVNLINRVIPSGDNQSNETGEILDCIAWLENLEGAIIIPKSKQGHQDPEVHLGADGTYKRLRPPKAEWSKEDEEMREKLLGEIEDMLEKLPDDYEDMDSDDQDRYNELNNMSVWLSNLIPKSHWKPSEEHLEALEDAVRLDNSVIRKERLAHLLTQLKNL